MKKTVFLLLFLFLILLPACGSTDPLQAASTMAPPGTIPVTEPSAAFFLAPEPETAPLPEEPVLSLTEAERTMLLKIGMAERGKEGCLECIALVMRTVLNRAESGRFGGSIRSVLFGKDQFTPVSNGTYDAAAPNESCYDALEMVTHGWDESQGALYYEWCEGESWHSKNLNLLFQHCDTRFYD